VIRGINDPPNACIVDMRGAQSFLAASRAAAFMPGWFGRQAPVRAVAPTLRPKSAPASYPATGPMEHVVSGTIFWPKACHAVFIG
jgi:hypothetical protein